MDRSLLVGWLAFLFILVVALEGLIRKFAGPDNPPAIRDDRPRNKVPRRTELGRAMGRG
jgi:hypothetical protein